MKRRNFLQYLLALAAAPVVAKESIDPVLNPTIVPKKILCYPECSEAAANILRSAGALFDGDLVAIDDKGNPYAIKSGEERAVGIYLGGNVVKIGEVNALALQETIQLIGAK